MKTLESIKQLRVRQSPIMELDKCQFEGVTKLAQFSAVGAVWLPQALWISKFQLVCHRAMENHLQRQTSTPWTTNWMLASLLRVSLWEPRQAKAGPTQSPAISSRPTAKTPRPLSVSVAKVMTVSASGNSTVTLTTVKYRSSPWTPSAATVNFQTSLPSVRGTPVRTQTVPSAMRDGKVIKA